MSRPGEAGGLLLLLMAGVAAADSTDDRASSLERQLVAPCCWRQPLSEHLSEEANRLKAEIRRRLAEGWTEQEIRDHYVRQYGLAILAKPPYQGFHLLAYLLPMLFLAGLGVGLGRWLARTRGQPGRADPVALPPGPYAAQLAQELRGFER